METYKEMRKRHQDGFNEFSDAYCFYAFSNEQFERGFNGMKSRGLVATEADLCRFGAVGMFCAASKADELHDLLKAQREEEQEAMKDYDFAFGAFLYEAGNHEYCINWQANWDTVGCFYPVEYDEECEGGSEGGVKYLIRAGAADETCKAYVAAIREHYRMAEENGWY